MLKFIKQAACAAVILGLAAGASAQTASRQLAAPANEAEPNTTGPIDRPLVTVIAPGVYFINEFGADAIYLVVGQKRALVIDSGSGFFDLKALVASLTPLPYDVAITHGHPDHAGGIGQFASVYLNPADEPMARAITYDGRVRYGRIMRKMSTAQLGSSIGFDNVWRYDDQSVRQWASFPTIAPLADGHIFDLGGRKVTAHHVGNHTPGSTVFVDDESRILFSGDAVNYNVGAIGPVSQALRSVLKVRALSKGYDRIYNGHIAYADRLEAIPEDPKALDDIIENFRSVLRGTATVTTVHNHLFPERVQTVAVHGLARNSFYPEKLWAAGEPHVVP